MHNFFAVFQNFAFWSFHKTFLLNSLRFGGFDGSGGGFFDFVPFAFSLSDSDEVSKSLWRLLLLPMLLMMSLSLLSEFEALRFFLFGLEGGGTGGKLDLLLVLPLRLPRSEDLLDVMAFVTAELLAMLMQPIPLRFFGFLVRWF